MDGIDHKIALAGIDLQAMFADIIVIRMQQETDILTRMRNLSAIIASDSAYTNDSIFHFLSEFNATNICIFVHDDGFIRSMLL
jgi:hypothetical protein